MNKSRGHMDALTSGLDTKSDKMRALWRAGYPKAEIARFLGVRYQFVRNVLVQDEARQIGAADPIQVRAPEPAKLRLGPDGRVVIPAAFREALGLSEGDTLVASMVDDELRLLTLEGALRRARAIVKQFAPQGVSLSDELIEDRRREIESGRNDD